MATELAKAYVQIIPTAKGVKQNLSSILESESESAGSSSGSKFASAFGKGLKATAGLATAAAGAATAVGASAVKAGQEFDSAMSQVVATMGYSMDELNDENSAASKSFTQLRSFAQQMGSTTAFSATEAAEALNYMALAGYDADTSMKMLPSVLNLAAAGGIDLASASDMVTDAQTALGLSLDQTTSMVDQMAVTASSSNTSVAQLGEAFLTIGANARDLSGGTTELSTLLGVLADNGIKGAEAGTHLRNIMLAMNPTTKEAKAAWESLGVSAYDASGELRPLTDVMGDISTATADLTTQEKQDILTKMFNKTDLASINALLGTDIERFGELSSAIDNSKGSADAMASVQLNNLAGDITLFQSALEGAKIAISDEVTPTLREFTQFGAEAISSLSSAFQEGGLTGAMEALGSLLSEGLAMVLEKLPEVVEAGLSLLNGLLQGISDNLPMIIDTVVLILGAVSQDIIDNLPMLIDAGFSILTQLMTSVTDAIPGMGDTIIAVMTAIFNGFIDNAPMLLDSGITLIETLAFGLIDAIPKLVEELPKLINGIINFIVTSAPKIAEAGVKIFTALIQNLPAIISGIVKSLPDLIQGIVKAIPTLIGTIAKAGVELFIALIKNLPTIIVEIVKALPQIVMGIIDGFASLAGDMAVVGKDLIEGLWNGIKNVTKWIKEKISGFVDDVVGSIKDFFGIHSPSKVMAQEVGQWIPKGMAEGIEDNAGVVEDAMKELEQDATGAITGQLNTEFSTSGVYSGSLSVRSSTTETRILDILEKYLPEAAEPSSVNVSLGANTKGLFNVVRAEAQKYSATTGNMAFG